MFFSYIPLVPVQTCTLDVRILGRPDVSDPYKVTVNLVDLPAQARIYLHNDTFYPASCTPQKCISLIYSVLDSKNRTQHASPLVVRATVYLKDIDTLATLSSFACEELPTYTKSFGRCTTTTNPGRTVLVQIIVTTTTASFSDSKLLTAGLIPAQPQSNSSSWHVDSHFFLQPVAPIIAGDQFDVLFASRNTPAQSFINFFTLWINLPSYVTFKELKSSYTTTTVVVDGLISVIGTSTARLSPELLTLTVQISPASTRFGLSTILSVDRAGTFITLSDDTTLATGQSIARGYSADLNGNLSMLLDYRRITGIIPTFSRFAVVRWHVNSNLTWKEPLPLSASAISVYSVMTVTGTTPVTCSSTPDFLNTTYPCSPGLYREIKRSGVMPVFVSYGDIQEVVSILVYDPTVPVISHFNTIKLDLTASDGYTGYQGIDVTSLVISGLPPPPAVTGLPVDLYPVVWGKGGTWTALRYSLPRPTQLSSSRTSLAAFWVITTSNQEEFTSNNVSSLDSTRVSQTSLNLTIIRAGETSSCVGIGGNYSNLAYGSTSFIPVIQPTPRSLVFITSKTILVWPGDPYLSNTLSIQDVLILVSDGSRTSVMNSPRLRVIVPNPFAIALRNSTISSTGLFQGRTSLVASMDRMPCVSGLIYIDVYASSVVSYALSCPSCPLILTALDDPLAILYPDRVLNSFPASMLSITANLVDGSTASVQVNISSLLPADASLDSQGRISSLQSGVLNIFYLGSNVISIRVARRFSAYATIVPSASTVTLLGDPAMLSPFNLPINPTFQVKVTTITWDVLAIPANITIPNMSLPGIYEVSARLNASLDWGIPDPSPIYIRVVSVLSLLVTPPAPVYNLHCSGIFQQASTKVTGILSDDSSVDLTAFATLSTSSSKITLSPTQGLFHPTSPGNYTLSWAFGRLKSNFTLLALNQSLLATSTAMSGLPSSFYGPIGTSTQLTHAFSPSLDPGWTTPDAVAAKVLTVQSNTQTSITTSGTTRAILVSDWYTLVIVQVTLSACMDQPAIPYYYYAFPRISPAPDGGIDAGFYQYGLVLSPVQNSSTFRLPVYIQATSGALTVYDVKIYYPSPFLTVLSLENSDSIQDSFCSLLRAPSGSLYVSAGASYAKSTILGRVLLCTITFTPTFDGVASLYLTSESPKISGLLRPTTSRNVSILVGAGGTWHYPDNLPTLIPGRRLLATSSKVWGDTEGVGKFSLLSVAFMEQYILYIPVPGNPKICIDPTRCQRRDDMTDWQKQQLDPISDPNAPYTIQQGGQPRNFLLGVLAGTRRFLSSWEIVNRLDYLSFAILLTDLNNAIAMSNCRITLVISSSKNTFRGMDVLARTSSQVNVSLNGSFAETHSLTTEQGISVSIETQIFDLSSYSPVPYTFTFLPSRPISTFSVTGTPLTTSTTPQPTSSTVTTTTPAPTRPRATKLIVCCDLTGTFEGSPAQAFVPAVFMLESVNLSYSDNSTTNISFSALSVGYDKYILDFTAPNTWHARGAFAEYRGPVQTIITLYYSDADSNATLTSKVTITLVDVRILSIQPELPVIHRIHCSTFFQNTKIWVYALVDGGIGSILITEGLTLTYLSSQAGYLISNTLYGSAPGSITLLASWRGRQGSLTYQISSLSVPFTEITCSPSYTFLGYQGESRQAILSGTYTLLDNTTITVPDLYKEGLSTLIHVSTPPCLDYTQDKLIARSNSYKTTLTYFSLSPCDNSTAAQLTCSSPTISNLIPHENDVDAGIQADSDLASDVSAGQSISSIPGPGGGSLCSSMGSLIIPVGVVIMLCSIAYTSVVLGILSMYLLVLQPWSQIGSSVRGRLRERSSSMIQRADSRAFKLAFSRLNTAISFLSSELSNCRSVLSSISWLICLVLLAILYSI
jgi:hypothetical protein